MGIIHIQMLVPQQSTYFLYLIDAARLVTQLEGSIRCEPPQTRAKSYSEDKTLEARREMYSSCSLLIVVT